ncbi:ribulose-phosphate 3-epimerase [Coriobacteriia bacterium Es71-Z0120]|uniref:ribulose-phosphate 3-epimerase n=1 Tax=Parvivirga hydrogeniphila TaxID=2939460 RepID=UPI002260CE85|nr:ribulose-phosphate 3-epimerase [Parvivirga hydrogeniphila]MCL4079062.1 ribulose-phosphate 3-epimerase [Parvivirga hydrogeniphila]
MSNVLIAPSILSADFADLGSAIRAVERAGADLIHVDVMDGHFVPNLTVGPPVVRALKRIAHVPLDVHLMIDNPDDTVQWYLDAGADIVVVHVEACRHVHRVVRSIKEAGRGAGVSLNPGTPLSFVEPVLQEVDQVLVMSVDPGFGGQAFIPASLERIHELTRMIASTGSAARIAVDGGIDGGTARAVVEAGATLLVAGNAIFSAQDPGAALVDLRTAATTAVC